MSIKKIAEQGQEKKFLAFALVGWSGTSVAIGVLIALMTIGPSPELTYFIGGIINISIVVFVGLGILFVPLILIDYLRILRYKRRIDTH